MKYSDDFEPIDDLNEKEFDLWLDVYSDILCLEELDRRATVRARYLKVRDEWRYGWLRTRGRRRHYGRAR